MTRLDERRESSRFRRRQTRTATAIEQQFASNDYLSLSQHPQVLKAAKDALDRWGFGSGGSPLLSGYSNAHRELEEALAEWLDVEAVVLFNSGFAANHGTISTLIQTGTIYFDRLSHASLIDGIRSTKRRFKRFEHNRIADLSAELTPTAEDWVVSEGTFSMDGDRIPEQELRELQQHSKVSVLLDDAHGLGVWGEQGLASYGALRDNIRLLTGTFGKAFGASGAFVAGSGDDIEELIQFCREYIYSTAFAPAQAAAIQAALTVIRSDEGAELRARLAHIIDDFKDQVQQRQLNLIASDSPIQSWVVGDDQQVMLLKQQLQQAGFAVSAVRPPTVPEGSARIRFSLQAQHRPQHIAALCQQLDKLS